MPCSWYPLLITISAYSYPMWYDRIPYLHVDWIKQPQHWDSEFDISDAYILSSFIAVCCIVMHLIHSQWLLDQIESYSRIHCVLYFDLLEEHKALCMLFEEFDKVMEWNEQTILIAWCCVLRKIAIRKTEEALWDCIFIW